MRCVITFVCFLFTSPLLWAQWTVVERAALPSSAGIDFAEVKVSSGKGASAALHVVIFDERTHALAVIDNPEGSTNLADAATAKGALAAVNGGYFHPDRMPLGLVVSNGEVLHRMERAKLLSGMIVVSTKDISLRRIGEFKMSPGVKEALQAGPFLIDGGKAVAGLNASRAAARTVVCTVGSNRVALVICRWTTLAETAEILLAPGIFPYGGKTTRALNLDGGSSTGMWVRSEGKPFYVREFKDVRNYLAVVKR